MKIMVSACLAGINCKYSGGNNRNERLMKLLEGHEVVTVCPEQLGGLPTPRVPSEIVDGVVMAKDGRNVDAQFRLGARLCLGIAQREKPDLVILQPRSPSCGVRQRYDGTFSGKLVDRPGVAAQLLMENGFRVADADEEDCRKLLADADEEDCRKLLAEADEEDCRKLSEKAEPEL